MAYRFDPNGDLVIDGWERGISSGPYSIFSPSALGPINQTGMVDLSYGNILGIPGEISVQFPLIASSDIGQALTLTGSLSNGATSATLNTAWAADSQTLSVSFSNGNTRNVVFTHSSTSITWSPGLVGAATATITANWTFGGAIQMATEYGVVGYDYCLDMKGTVWRTDEQVTSNQVTWTAMSSFGLNNVTVSNQGGCVWWQGYLFVMWLSHIYYSSDHGATFTDWTGTVGSIFDGNNYAISSKVSDSMYFCNGAAVASVILTPGQTFDPTNASTYTFQQTAVNIPSYDQAVSLGEINGQILIGGVLNRIYPWDANNLQATGITSLVGLPLFVGERGITRIVVVNSNAYIFCGTPYGAGTLINSGRGYIYVTNGSTIDVFAKMPDNFVSIGGSNSDISSPYWQFGDAIFHRNQLFFGAQAINNNSGSIIADTGGVWGIDIASQALYRVNETTSGNSALPLALIPFSVPANVTITNPPGLGYIVADTAAFNNSSSVLTTSARIISDKIPVGSKLEPKTFDQLELKCAVALVSGESIDVKVITDLDPSGHTIGSMTSADGMSKAFTPLTLSSSTYLQGIQWLQVQCTLNPTATNPTFVRLREIRLR